MTIFLESPWPAIGIGVVLEAVLVILLLRTGRGAILWAMAGVALLALGGVLLDWLVVTDREQVAATIEAGRAAAEANNVDRVLDFVSPSAQQVGLQARVVASQFQFTRIRVNGLEITVNHDASPPTATARFTAMVTLRGRSSDFFGEGTEPVNVTLQFRRESDRWLVTDYRYDQNILGTAPK